MGVTSSQNGHFNPFSYNDLKVKHVGTSPLHLKRDNVIKPLTSVINEWKDDLKKWPQIMYTSIFSYFNHSVVTDSEVMKRSEADQ